MSATGPRSTGIGMGAGMRRALARVNGAAIERNCRRICAELRDGATLCAVVKADGYGHGAVATARAALAGGARWLAVIDARELRELRDAGMREGRILVMGPLTEADMGDALAADGDVVIWDERQLRAVAAAGGGRVHVKLDTGMGRLGTRDVEAATRLARAAVETPGVELVGAMTHFATADELSDGGFFAAQLEAFTRWVRELRADHPGLLAHAANSAATLRDPAAQMDMVRCGVAIYGMDPFGHDAEAQGLEAALELSTYVAELKPAAPGESVGYGRRFVAEHETLIGVLPIGYGDGWRRSLTNNADVLVAGVRRPLVGTVSMDSITFDAGDDSSLLDAPAVLIGEQNGERITAEEVARRLGTINYEVTTGLTRRVLREHHRDGVPTELPLDADPDELGAAGAR